MRYLLCTTIQAAGLSITGRALSGVPHQGMAPPFVGYLWLLRNEHDGLIIVVPGQQLRVLSRWRGSRENITNDLTT
jgi:hypothetical protein